MISTTQIISAKMRYQRREPSDLTEAGWLEILDLAYEEARYREYARSNPGGLAGPLKKASCAHERIAQLEKENQKLEQRCQHLEQIVKDVQETVAEE